MAIALPLAFPSLGTMAQRNPLAILPSDAPSSVTAKKMTEAFQEPGNDNLLLVALINENGLEPADEATYRKLVDSVRDDVRDVVSVQDFVATPQLRPFLTSEDRSRRSPVVVARSLHKIDSLALTSMLILTQMIRDASRARMCRNST